MSWTEYEGFGGPERQSALAIVAIASERNEVGVIEIQTTPYHWESLCQELGSTRRVEIDHADGRAAFVTAVAGRTVRVFAVYRATFDYRFRTAMK